MTAIEGKPELLAKFEAAALPHLDDLFRTARSILDNPTEAEDAVQETYFQGWKSFERFTRGTNCRAWLFRILFHVISHNRRKWFSRVRLEEPEVFQETAGSAPVRQDLSDEEILAAIRKMPREYAEVVLLADVHEFTGKEIQETLGVPLGTVMSRLSRGRKLLRGYLSNLAPTASGASVDARPVHGRTPGMLSRTR